MSFYKACLCAHCVLLYVFNCHFINLSEFCIFCSILKLYPSLCELAHVLSVDGPVRQKLDSLAGELAKAADKELQVRFVSLSSLSLI